MGQDWIEYKCKSGETLVLYNKVTGEHKWPYGLPEGIMYNNASSYMKEFATAATQTDDSGCNNGCMSMYINSDPYHVSKNTSSDDTVPQPKSGVSNEVSVFCWKLGLTSKCQHEQKEIQSSQTLTAKHSKSVRNITSDDGNDNNDPSENTLRDATDESFNHKFYNIPETSRELVEMRSSTQQNLINDSGDSYGNDNKDIIDNDNESNGGDEGEPGDSNDLINISRSELEEVVNVLEDAERLSEVDMLGRRNNICESTSNKDIWYIPQQGQNNNTNIGQMYKATSRQQRHALVIPREKSFECTYCKRKFTQKCNLNVHIRTHTGIKPFKCSYCKKPFADKSSLAKHVRVHTGEKPFNCSVCEKKFRRRDTLNTHVKTHTGEKPFSCTVCNTKFAQRGNLKVHFKIHTGEKPFECSICKKKFSRRSTLKVHLRTSCFKS